MTREIRLIVLYVCAIALAVLFTSCRSIKKDKTSQTESVKTELSTKATTTSKEENHIAEVSKKESNDTAETIIEETIIEREGVKQTTRKTTIKSNKAVQEISDVHTTISKDTRKQQTTAQRTETKQKTTALKVDKKQTSFWFLAWLLIPLGLYLLYKKYKNQIWWI